MYDTRQFITSDISEGFVIFGRYDKKTQKISWRDYSKKIKVEQQGQIISKILSYGVLSSPLVIVPLIALFSRTNSSSTIVSILGGEYIFWILTVILSFLVTNSILYRAGKHQYEGEEIATPSIIVVKNVITYQIDRGLRRYRTNDTSLESSRTKTPYWLWMVVSLVLLFFTAAAYYFSNDVTAGFGGQLFGYIILVILVSTIIAVIQIVIPTYFKLLNLEKKIDSKIKLLSSEEIERELNKAEEFYKSYQVSGAAIKKYLAEYKKILKEKEMEIKNEQH